MLCLQKLAKKPCGTTSKIEPTGKIGRWDKLKHPVAKRVGFRKIFNEEYTRH